MRNYAPGSRPVFRLSKAVQYLVLVLPCCRPVSGSGSGQSPLRPAVNAALLPYTASASSPPSPASASLGVLGLPSLAISLSCAAAASSARSTYLVGVQV